MSTLAGIAARMEQAAGKAIINHIANPDPRKDDLPIRQHVTGKIVAYLPARYASDARPVVRNGLAVGYMITSQGKTYHPFFLGTDVLWAEVEAGEEWMVCFREDGTGGGGAVRV